MLSLIGHKQDSTLESEHIIDEIVAWFRIHEGKQQIKTIQTRRGWSDQAPALFLSAFYCAASLTGSASMTASACSAVSFPAR